MCFRTCGPKPVMSDFYQADNNERALANMNKKRCLLVFESVCLRFTGKEQGSGH